MRFDCKLKDLKWGMALAVEDRHAQWLPNGGGAAETVFQMKVTKSVTRSVRYYTISSCIISTNDES